MKSKMKRRMLAIVLCMVIVLSNSSFIFASSESGTPAVEAAGTEGTTSQTETDTQGTETTPQTLAVSESTPAPTDEPAAPTSVEATPTPTDTPEVTTTPEPTGTPTPEATPTPTDTLETTTTPEPTDAPEITMTPELTDTPEATTTPEPTNTPEATPTPTQGPENGTSDTAQPTATPTPTEAPVKSNEAVELKQEFKDSDGNVTSTVKAQIPEGTFAADASEITMEVQTPDAASAEHVKEMMEELLPENHMLGDYIFYDIQFKVNGTVTEPQKPITITFEGEELSVKDVKRANVFWLDPEDPQVDGDKDQLVEITQKSEMIENLQNSGQSTENIDDYDLSEITLKEDGTSDKIQMEGRTSTIYGCYVVYEPVQVLTYDDDQVTITVSAAEEVFPEGTTFAARRIESTTDEYSNVEESLENEAAKTGTDVLDFVAYDLTFFNREGNEIEPDGEVEVSFEFHDMKLGGISEESNSVDVVHINDDATTEIVQSNIDVNNEQLNKVDFIAEQFSIYAVTARGISERYTSDITIGDYAIIEFWDKDIEGGNQEIEFTEYTRDEYNGDSRYLKIEVYVNDRMTQSTQYKLNMKDDAYSQVNLQTTVKPGNGYYLQKECIWQKAGVSDSDKFGGSGSTGLNKATDSPKVNTLRIYLTSDANNNCAGEVTQATKNISVDLYNYDTETYNSSVGLDSNSLLLRSSWGNYKADNYNIADEENNGHNASCGKTGIFYGLVAPQLSGGNIVFKKEAKFFDNAFDPMVGTKYTGVNFEFLYNDQTKEYSYSSEKNHVHFDETTNTISQYKGTGPNTLPDGSDLTRYGFFPFTDENDNMTDYGFGMRMNVEFELTEDGTIDGTTPMTFHFSGDDDVWVFIDGKLALDLGGLHSRRGGTINFSDGTVTYDEVTYKKGDETITTDVKAVSGAKPDTAFLKNLEKGTHTLTMYYLERGGNDSNCEIKFNLLVVNREGTLEFEKIDSDTKQKLSGVSFNLYDTSEITNETEPIATAVSDAEGKVVFDISGLDVSKTYYLKETTAPFGYQKDDTVYQVKLSQQQNGTTITVGGTIKNSAGTIITAIENTPKENTGGTTTVTVKKEWQEGVEKVPVEMTLYANGQKVEHSGIQNPITLDNEPWEYTWRGLPGDTEYTVLETPLQDYITSSDTEYQFSINSPYEVVRPCNELERELGSNGVVAIKKGSDYFVWTAVELNSEEKAQLLQGIRLIQNGFDDNSTTFGYGSGDFKVLDGTFSFDYDYSSGKLQMNIDATKAWSWFLLGTYTKTVNTTITNGIDTTKTIDITVEKQWRGDEEDLKPYQSVTVQLYQNNKPYEEPVVISPDANGQWIHTYKGLDYYSKDTSGKYIINEYDVKETHINTFPIENTTGWLVVDISGNAQDGFVITNTVPTPWFIRKVSSTDEKLPLDDARFTLTSTGESPIRHYYGKSYSNGNGRVLWWENEADVGNIDPNKMVMFIPDGKYLLEETKAPTGYQKSEIVWTIEIEDYSVKSITYKKGNEVIEVNPEELVTRTDMNGDSYVYENKPVFDLPSSGGSGIFGYTMGGTLLLMAGTLILYKMKRKEVQGS